MKKKYENKNIKNVRYNYKNKFKKYRFLFNS